MLKNIITLLIIFVTMSSCSNTAKRPVATESQEVKAFTPAVVFNGDSAYKYVDAQCAFGARVPNTEAHRKCGDYLVAELQRHGAKVYEQKTTMRAYDGTQLEVRNIIGEYYPEKMNRILLLAHWDCRPWADNDKDDNQKQPVMGANDGASGVGVLLEIARVLAENEPQTGIDILFTDAEDWGDSGADDPESWALGTQYWVANPHRAGYTRPAFGILLDMVGDRNATFLREYFSMQHCGGVVDRLWETAAKLGYSNYFLNKQGGAMTDDHVFVIKGGIPCVDVIDQRMDSGTGFCPQWHTIDDTMKHIDPATLKAVGQTVVTMIFGK